MAKRSLYQCFNAKVQGVRIVCSNGYKLGISSNDINALALQRGSPLEISTCQHCPDYNEMGPPIPRGERGGYLLNIKE